MAKFQIFARFGISPLILAIFLGAILGNFAKNLTQNVATSGALGISTKQILRLGVILYGFRISFGNVASVGVYGAFAAFWIVFATFGFGYFVGRS